MTVLKPSANLFALLDSNDPGDDAVLAKADAAASAPVNINKKQQQPEPSIWKLKAIEANTAKKKKKPQPAASKAKPFSSSAPTASRKPPPQPQPAASNAYYKAGITSNAAANKHQPAAPTNLAGELFGRAYPSARYFIYQNRKPRDGAENAKDGGAVQADDKKGGKDAPRQKDGVRANGAAPVKRAPAAPAKEEPPAPVKPPVPPPPPPKLEDLKQFPGLK